MKRTFADRLMIIVINYLIRACERRLVDLTSRRERQQENLVRLQRARERYFKALGV